MDEKITFKTKDLNQAAFLWCQTGTELLGVDAGGEEIRRPGITLYFHFSLPMSDSAFAALLLDYTNERCTVEPQRFCECQRKLRDLLHQSLPNRHDRKTARGRNDKA